MTTFLSAFLLFQVQLIVAKSMLPWFGGTATVWITCMLYFQVALLVGYAYAFGLVRLALKNQVRVHAMLLTFAVIVLMGLGFWWRAPLLPSVSLRPAPGADPSAAILGLLALSTGVPFIVLSATSPLLQSWFARAHATSPYRFYALSNAGSLLGLLTYPAVFEPWLKLRAQAWLWTAFFLLYTATLVWLLSGMPDTETLTTSGPPPKREPWPERCRPLLWLALAACGTMTLLAATSLLTLDVAAVPLLWVIPLAIYLVTFILSFERPAWYSRVVFHPMLACAVALACNLLFRHRAIPFVRGMFTFCFALFAICMFCHGELARSKPAAHSLTRYYLTIAAGGALGALFASLIAPHIFLDLFEMETALVFAMALLIVVLLTDADSWLRQESAWKALSLLFTITLVPLVLAVKIGVALGPLLEKIFYSALGVAVAIVLAALWRYVPGKKRAAHPGWLALASMIVPLCYGGILYLHTQSLHSNVIFRARNFFGVLRVEELYRSDPAQHSYVLLHGKITHGLQLIDPAYHDSVTTYYTADSGVGLALTYHPRRWRNGIDRNLRVGAVGLGAGTLAQYGIPGDTFRFYEIDPKIIALSAQPNSLFSFVRDSKADVSVRLGDARVTMEEELRRDDLQHYDVIVLDAFSSDAVPVHLLTREAFRVYLAHLRDDEGLLAIHTSNRAVDLVPVVARLAEEFQLYGSVIDSKAQGTAVYESTWIVLSRKLPVLTLPPGKELQAIPLHPTPGFPLWTDEYSNLLRILK